MTDSSDVMRTTACCLQAVVSTYLYTRIQKKAMKMELIMPGVSPAIGSRNPRINMIQHAQAGRIIRCNIVDIANSANKYPDLGVTCK